MSKRRAAAISPPLGHAENGEGPRRSARLATAAHRDEQSGAVAVAAAATRPTAAAAAAASSVAASADPAHRQLSAAADSSADDGGAVASAALSSSSSSSSSCSPFGRLATVELQLIMHGCDRRSLIALARCSRSTLAAAAHPFAWRSLPLRLHCSRPSEITAWRPLQSAESLLRHADQAVYWTLESAAAATAEEVAAALALPRLHSLAINVVNSDGCTRDEEPILGESASFVLVNALRTQLDGGRPSPNFVLSLSLRFQRIGAVGAAAIADLVEHNPSLTRLDLKGNKAIEGDALIALCVAAGKSSSLRHLNLSDSGNVNTAVATALAHALTQSTSLTELELRGCRMDAAAAKALSPGVKASSSLQRLYLDSDREEHDNRLGNDGVAALTAALAGSQSLTDLELAECDMDADGVAVVAAALQQCGSMRKLLLGANSLDGASVAALGRLLSADQCKIASLDLTRNGITAADAAALAESLQFNTSLTELLMPHFPNLAALIAPLSVALQRSGGRSALRSLFLSECAIGPPQVAALSDLLRGDNAVEQLYFSASIFSARLLAALAPTIGISRLTRLDFCNSSSLGDAGLAALVPGLCACPGLRRLNLWECRLTPASAASLVRIVQQCRSLEWLNLGCNTIGDDGACAIFAALHSGSSLRGLFFSDIDVDMRGMAAMVSAINRGWNPTHLILDPTSDMSESVLALAAALERRGPALRLEWMRAWCHGLTVSAAVALVRAVHRIPTMRILDLWCSLPRNDAAAVLAVRAACSARPEVAVCLLEESDQIAEEMQ